MRSALLMAVAAAIGLVTLSSMSWHRNELLWSGRQVAGQEASAAFDKTHDTSAWLSPSGRPKQSAEHHFELPSNSQSFAVSRGITRELVRQQQLHAFHAQHILGNPSVVQPGVIGKTTTVQGALNAAGANVGVYKGRHPRRRNAARAQKLKQFKNDYFTRIVQPASIGHTTTVEGALRMAGKNVGVYKKAPTQMLWNAQKTQPYNPMAHVSQAAKVNKMIMQWQSHADHVPAGSDY